MRDSAQLFLGPVEGLSQLTMNPWLLPSLPTMLASLTQHRLREAVIAACNTIRGANTKEGEELLKLKGKAGTRASGYELAMSAFKQEIRRQFLTIREAMCWNSFPIGAVGAKRLAASKMELHQFMMELYNVVLVMVGI